MFGLVEIDLTTTTPSTKTPPTTTAGRYKIKEKKQRRRNAFSVQEEGVAFKDNSIVDNQDEREYKVDTLTKETDSSVACQALRIVLQHYLMSSKAASTTATTASLIGWDGHVFTHHYQFLPRLRDDLLEETLIQVKRGTNIHTPVAEDSCLTPFLLPLPVHLAHKPVPSSHKYGHTQELDIEDLKQQLMKELRNPFGYPLPNNYLQTLQTQLLERSDEIAWALLQSYHPSSPSSEQGRRVVHMEHAYSNDVVNEIVMHAFKVIWWPSVMLLRHQAMSLSQLMTDRLLWLHQSINACFQQQQQRFRKKGKKERGVSSLIVYQLITWFDSLSPRLEILQSLVFSFTLLSFQLLQQYHRVIEDCFAIKENLAHEAVATASSVTAPSGMTKTKSKGMLWTSTQVVNLIKNQVLLKRLHSLHPLLKVLKNEDNEVASESDRGDGFLPIYQLFDHLCQTMKLPDVASSSSSVAAAALSRLDPQYDSDSVASSPLRSTPSSSPSSASSGSCSSSASSSASFVTTWMEDLQTLCYTLLRIKYNSDSHDTVALSSYDGDSDSEGDYPFMKLFYDPTEIPALLPWSFPASLPLSTRSNKGLNCVLLTTWCMTFKHSLCCEIKQLYASHEDSDFFNAMDRLTEFYEMRVKVALLLSSTEEGKNKQQGIKGVDWEEEMVMMKMKDALDQGLSRALQDYVLLRRQRHLSSSLSLLTGDKKYLIKQQVALLDRLTYCALHYVKQLFDYCDHRSSQLSSDPDAIGNCHSHYHNMERGYTLLQPLCTSLDDYMQTVLELMHSHDDQTKPTKRNESVLPPLIANASTLLTLQRADEEETRGRSRDMNVLVIKNKMFTMIERLFEMMSIDNYQSSLQMDLTELAMSYFIDALEAIAADTTATCSRRENDETVVVCLLLSDLCLFAIESSVYTKKDTALIGGGDNDEIFDPLSIVVMDVQRLGDCWLRIAHRHPQQTASPSGVVVTDTDHESVEQWLFAIQRDLVKVCILECLLDVIRGGSHGDVMYQQHCWTSYEQAHVPHCLVQHLKDATLQCKLKENGEEEEGNDWLELVINHLQHCCDSLPSAAVCVTDLHKTNLAMIGKYCRYHSLSLFALYLQISIANDFVLNHTKRSFEWAYPLSDIRPIAEEVSLGLQGIHTRCQQQASVYYQGMKADIMKVCVVTNIDKELRDKALHDWLFASCVASCCVDSSVSSCDCMDEIVRLMQLWHETHCKFVKLGFMIQEPTPSEGVLHWLFV